MVLRDTRCFASKMRSRWIHVLASFSRPGPASLKSLFPGVGQYQKRMRMRPANHDRMTCPVSDPTSPRIRCILGAWNWPSPSMIGGTLEEKTTTNGSSPRAHETAYSVRLSLPHQQRPMLVIVGYQPCAYSSPRGPFPK